MNLKGGLMAQREMAGEMDGRKGKEMNEKEDKWRERKGRNGKEDKWRARKGMNGKINGRKGREMNGKGE